MIVKNFCLWPQFIADSLKYFNKAACVVYMVPKCYVIIVGIFNHAYYNFARMMNFAHLDLIQITCLKSISNKGNQSR